MVGDYWTKYKLERINAHLPRFTREMDAKGVRTLYVDAFAGDGIVDLPKAKTLRRGILKDLKIETCVPGSAARALTVDPPFDRYLLNDLSEVNCRRLKEVGEASTIRSRAFVTCRDANDFILNVCAKKDWKKTRAVFVVDPYATQFRWESLKAIAETKASDVWYLFPFSTVTRLLAKKGLTNEAKKQRLRDVLGVNDLDGEFYHTWVETGLSPKYSHERTARTKDVGELVKFVKERFRSIFPFVAKPTSVENRMSSTMFLLFFASSIPGERETTEFVKQIMSWPFNAPLPASLRS